MFQVKPIGIIHSLYKTEAECPPQGKSGQAEIEIFKQYEDGLKDIEGFSHVHLFYWLHKSNHFTLSVKTPWDSVPHGLFTTRTPNRPNPVGYSAIEIVSRKGNTIMVKGMDAMDGTPVFDIKPYIPSLDAKPQAKNGWLSGKKVGGER